MRELAKEAGVPSRTIRFYISRGLLPGPVVAGRRAAYSEEHLRRIRKIRELQQQGLTLGAIGGVLQGENQEQALPQPVAWNSYAIDDDVAVWVRGDASPWRQRQIRDAMRQFADRIRELNKEGDDSAETR